VFNTQIWYNRLSKQIGESMKKHVIIYNLKEVKSYINQVSQNIRKESVKDWVSSNFYNYLINDYKKFNEVYYEELDYANEILTIQKAIDNNEKIVSIKFTIQLKRDIEHIIDYLHSDKAPKNLSRLSFKDSIDHSKKWTENLNKVKMENDSVDFDSLNIIHKLNDDYFIVQLETKDEFNLEGKDMNHCVLEYYNRYKKNNNFVIWSIRNKHNKPTATVELVFNSYSKSVRIPQFKGRFNRGMIDRDAARLFYNYLEEEYTGVYFEDLSAFGNKQYDQRISKHVPLSLWEENGIINDLDLSDQYITQLPKKLTVLGNLNIVNTQICFLGEELKVKGSIFAKGSQLAVIDETVEVDGKIYAEDTLLISHPTHLSDKISKEKTIYLENQQKTVKLK
jgi:hypothetical protein